MHLKSEVIGKFQSARLPPYTYPGFDMEGKLGYKYVTVRADNRHINEFNILAVLDLTTAFKRFGIGLRRYGRDQSFLISTCFDIIKHIEQINHLRTLDG